jgi:hypothetical protein
LNKIILLSILLQYTLNILFKTSTLRGSTYDIATCPATYTLDTTGGSGNYVCKKVLTKLFPSNGDLQNSEFGKNEYTSKNIGNNELIEKVFFGRSHEQIISEMSKFSNLFKIYVDLSDKYGEDYLKYINSPQNNDNIIFNISTPSNDWKTSLKILSDTYISDNDNSEQISINMEKISKNYPDVQCYHKKSIDDIAMLVYKLHVYLMVETITGMSYALPQNIYSKIIQGENLHPKKRESTNKETSFMIKSCSGNTYAAYDPISGSYYCACYSDKNCHVDISSISENESFHPLLLTCIIFFIFLLTVLIYTDLSAITMI